jgi:hypothetical protein
MRREKIQINKIRDIKEDIIINANEIRSTIREYFEKLQINWKNGKNGLN